LDRTFTRKKKKKKMGRHTRCLFGIFLLLRSASAVPNSNASWALLAWGFENGGKDIVSADTTMVDVDLFDQADLIPNLKSAGHTVVCYLSAGSWESWRPDADDPNWEYIKIGKMSGWDELWLDVRNLTALAIVMGNRMDLAVSEGCDGIEPDNIDCYDNRACWSSMTNPTEPNGKAVEGYQIAYNMWLANYAHRLHSF
jgi:hypothetical protein